jgi:putative SOS response-associated peptidase YedK
MCSTVKQVDSNSAIVKALKPLLTEGFKFDTDVYPKGQIALIADDKIDALQDAYWSLVPNWSPMFIAPKYATFNAKKENLLSSKTWQPLIGKKHCVIVCTGFYEWHWDNPTKKIGSHRYYLKQANSEITFMAGLWESWTNITTGEILKSCTMITNPANEMMSEIHNVNKRMPAFLTAENYKHWIDSELSLNDRMQLIEPVPNDFLNAVEVAKK